MGKLQSIKGVTKTLVWMTREEFDEMDKKFFRIVGGVAGFIGMALLWFFFLRHITPF